jgi:hypothetical protein
MRALVLNLVVATYMHIHPLSIPPISIHNHRDNNQLFLRNKVPNASLVLGGVVCCYGVEIEFEGCCEGEEGEQHAAEETC